LPTNKTLFIHSKNIAINTMHFVVAVLLGRPPMARGLLIGNTVTNNCSSKFSLLFVIMYHLTTPVAVSFNKNYLYCWLQWIAI